MPVSAAVDLRTLFHRLNNQLSIILANAELLEVQVSDPAHRARAAQVVSSTLDAMSTTRDIHARADQLRRLETIDVDDPPRIG
jgi:hypothetical protein